MCVRSFTLMKVYGQKQMNVLNEWMLWCLMSLFGKFVTPRQVSGHFTREQQNEPKFRTWRTSLEGKVHHLMMQPIGRRRAREVRMRNTVSLMRPQQFIDLESSSSMIHRRRTVAHKLWRDCIEVVSDRSWSWSENLRRFPKSTSRHVWEAFQYNPCPRTW